MHRRVHEAADYWNQNGRASGLLWRSPDLDLLRNYSHRAGAEFTSVQQAFFRASEQRIRREKLLKFATSSLVLMALLVSAIMWRRASLAETDAYSAFKQADAARFAEHVSRLAAEVIAAKSAAEAGTLQLRGPVTEDTADQLGLLQLAKARSVADNLPEQQRIVDTLWYGWQQTIADRLVHVAGHDEAVVDVTFSSDGRYFATASEDATARVWSLETGRPVSPPLNHGDAVTLVRFSPATGDLASASEDGEVRLWNAKSQFADSTALVHEGAVISLDFSADGQLLATGTDQGEAKLWEATSARLRSDLLTQAGRVHSVAFSPQGTRLVTMSTRQAHDKQQTAIHLWNALPNVGERALGDPVTLFKQFENAIGQVTTAHGLSFHPSGESLAFAYERDARLLSVGDTLMPETKPLARHGNIVWALQISADGSKLVTASSNNTPLLVSLSASDSPSRNTNRSIFLRGHNGDVRAVAFSPDSRLIATASWDQTVRVFDVETAQLGSRGQPFLHFGKVWALDFSPSGRYLASASSDGSARIWDVGQQHGKRLRHDGRVTAIDISDDGTWLATGSDDRSVKLWDAGSAKQSQEPIVQSAPWVISTSAPMGK